MIVNMDGSVFISETTELIEGDGNRIFAELLKVASGKKTKSEALGHNEFAIFRVRGHAD